MSIDLLRSKVIKTVRAKNKEVARAVVDEIIDRLKAGEELIRSYDQQILNLAYAIDHNNMGSEGECEFWEHINCLQREIEKIKKDNLCLYSSYLEKLTHLSKEKIHRLLNK